jgi:hypothetical protein
MGHWNSTLNVSSVWKKTEDGTIDTSKPSGFKEFMELLKPLIRTSHQFVSDADFRIIATKVLNSKSVQQFDNRWAELYDYCDYNRIWIKTH